jgi:Mn-dependent DtxR family transcriptional regulator
MSNDKQQYLHNPSYILNDGNLDPTKKILLSYILSLSKSEKGCYASNERFGELLNINPDGASKQISKLKRLGYIETRRFFKNSKEYRYIKVLNISNNKNNKQNEIFINIPYSVLFDINLSSTQKLLLSEILTLLKLPEGCYKSNNDFGKLIGIGGGGISKQIKKLVEMKYIITEEIKIDNVANYRKITLTTSYMTRDVLPKSQEVTSQTTKDVLSKSQEGTSYRNTISTIYNTNEILPVLAQFTSTEKIIEKSETEILEQKIIDSCEQGAELLIEIKRGKFENYWKYSQQKDTREHIIQLLKEYKAATKDLEINNSSTKT